MSVFFFLRFFPVSHLLWLDDCNTNEVSDLTCTNYSQPVHRRDYLTALALGNRFLLHPASSLKARKETGSVRKEVCRGRRWRSPPGDLFPTLLPRPPSDPRGLASMSLSLFSKYRYKPFGCQTMYVRYIFRGYWFLARLAVTNAQFFFRLCAVRFWLYYLGSSWRIGFWPYWRSKTCNFICHFASV